MILVKKYIIIKEYIHFNYFFSYKITLALYPESIIIINELNDLTSFSFQEDVVHRANIWLLNEGQVTKVPSNRKDTNTNFFRCIVLKGIVLKINTL